MARRDYLRPLGLVYGQDAKRLIADGRAGALGGSSWIGFTAVEVINRYSQRRPIIAFAEAASHVDEIVALRASFAGLDLSVPQIMGIVNVTPDSFSDGGLHADEARAIAHGEKLLGEGAALLDVGGESTRPGAAPVPVEEETARTEGVVRALAAPGHIISIDSRKTIVMKQAVRAGARIINDVSALTYDAASLSFVAEQGLPVILMHSPADPRTMQDNPHYDDVVLDVFDSLAERVAICRQAGISLGRICIDPGIGFGKTLNHNLEVMRALTLFHGLGTGLLIGLSRKSMIGVVTGEKQAGHRVAGSVGGALYAAQAGAHILRVHDVKETAAALRACMSLTIGPPVHGDLTQTH